VIRVEDKKLNDWLNYQLAEGRGITPGDGYDEFYLEDEDGNVYEGKYIWESEGFERLSINGEALEHNVVSFQHNGRSW
jgi:hypothetical protein